MYCNNCKNEVDDGQFFCPICKAPLNEAVMNIRRKENAQSIASEKKIWLIAILPWLLASLFLLIPLSDKNDVVFTAFALKRCVELFIISQDIRLVKRSVPRADMLLVGMILSGGLYIFVRENMTNKKYVPVIVYICMAIVFSIIRRAVCM